MSYGVTGQPKRNMSIEEMLRLVQMYVYPPSFEKPKSPSTIVVTQPLPLPLPKQPTIEELKLLAAKKVKALPIVLPAIEDGIFQDNKWIANKEGVNFKDNIWLSKDISLEMYTLWIFSSLINYVSKPIEDIYSIDTPEELNCLNPYYLVGAWVTTVVGPENYLPAYQQSLTFSEDSVRLDVDYTNPFERFYYDNAYVFINTPLASVYKYAEIRFYFGDFITGEKLDSTLPGYYEAMHNLAWYIGEEIAWDMNPYSKTLPNITIDSETNEFVYLKPIRPIYHNFTGITNNSLVELYAPATFKGRLITEGLHLIAYNPVIEDLDVYYADKETLYLNWNDETFPWSEQFETYSYMNVNYMVYFGVENILNFKFSNLSKMPGRLFITSLKLVQPVLD